MPARLAQHLTSQGLLPAAKVEAALRKQALSGGALDTVLLEEGAISEPGVLQALGDVSGLRLVNLADFEPNPEVAPLLPHRVAERLGVTPLSQEGQTLHVACAYPPARKEIAELGLLLGRHLEPWIAIEARVRDWISVIYKQPLSTRYAALLSALDPSRPAPTPALQVETSLEDSLTLQMVEQIARDVAAEPLAAEEPIPLRAPKNRPAPVQEAEPVASLGAPKAAPTKPPAAIPPAPSTPVSPVAAPAPTRAPAAAPLPAPAPASVAASVARPLPAPAPSYAERLQVEAAPLPTPSTERKRTEPLLPIPVQGEEIPRWTLPEAKAALRVQLTDRESLIDVALRYGRQTFDYVASFAVLQGTALGWDARGEGADRNLLSQVSVPLDAATVFRTVALTRSTFLGPPPKDQYTQQILGYLGRNPRTAFLFPVEVRGRLVTIIYGDCGARPISQRRLSEFVLFCQELPGAFQELILRRKRMAPNPAWQSVPLPEAPAPAEAPPPESGWSPSSHETKVSLGRSPAMTTRAPSEGIRPPPDYAPLLKKLLGPDAAERARAVAELARSPEASAKVLASQFPGPTAWSRLPVMELPEADELGPIPGALSRLGRAGAQALAPLLDSDDPDTRYLALLTAGNLPYADLVGGVLRGLFDFEPDLSSAARAAATSLKKLPRFDSAMKDLRQELASRDPVRRSLAARALGVLHDREAIGGLINLTGSDDQLCAQAAAEALREITKASFGTNVRAWVSWWAEHRERRRVEWLVAALRHRELDVRMSSIDELTRAVSDTLGYDPDAPSADREAAVRRWEALITQSERGRKFDL